MVRQKRTRNALCFLYSFQMITKSMKYFIRVCWFFKSDRHLWKIKKTFVNQKDGLMTDGDLEWSLKNSCANSSDPRGKLAENITIRQSASDCSKDEQQLFFKAKANHSAGHHRRPNTYDDKCWLLDRPWGIAFWSFLQVCRTKFQDLID